VIGAMKISRPLRFLGAVLLFGAFGFYGSLLYRRYVADTYYERAQVLLGKADYSEALVYAHRAIDINGKEPNYYRIRGKVYLLMTALDSEDVAIDVNKNLALTDMKTALSLNFDNLVTLRNIIPLYYFLALEDYSLPSAQHNIDESFINITRQYYAHVKRTYSHDVGVLAALAKYEKRLGLVEDYEESVALVRELRPDVLEWHGSFVP
jgi:tetratricopeptide (TPR) repeat protein